MTYYVNTEKHGKAGFKMFDNALEVQHIAERFGAYSYMFRDPAYYSPFQSVRKRCLCLVKFEEKEYAIYNSGYGLTITVSTDDMAFIVPTLEERISTGDMEGIEFIDDFQRLRELFGFGSYRF